MSFRAFHRFLQANLFYPVGLSTFLCVTLLVGRVVFSGTRNYDFLVWNLFLAWLPYLFAVWLVLTRRSEPHRPWKLIVPAALWLLFLPNAPYILTDFKHLLYLRPFPIYYDIALVFAAAWTGLLLGLASLYLLQREIARGCGRIAAGVFVVTTAFVTGAGVYVGRFMRWNSWDVWTRPKWILSQLADGLLNPWQHKGAFAHTLVFAVVVLVCHLTFLTLRGGERE